MALTYRLLFTDTAEKQLRKLDRPIERLIILWLLKNVDGAENPGAHGKTLSENLSGYWRYRVGDYRVICHIDDNVCEVLAVQIGHRSKIYK
jgi:mRNA interferase RelE/StbE